MNSLKLVVLIIFATQINLCATQENKNLNTNCNALAEKWATGLDNKKKLTEQVSIWDTNKPVGDLYEKRDSYLIQFAGLNIRKLKHTILTTNLGLEYEQFKDHTYSTKKEFIDDSIAQINFLRKNKKARIAFAGIAEIRSKILNAQTSTDKRILIANNADEFIKHVSYLSDHADVLHQEAQNERVEMSSRNKSNR
jgi:hypothetical protein